MAEKPVPSQDLVDFDLSNRVADTRADDRSPAPAPGIHQGARSAMHIRFAITPGKLREALFYRWRLALLVGLMCAGVGAGLAWLTYKPKYTATALLRMTSSKPRLLPGALQDDRERGAKFEEGFQKTQAQLLKARQVLDAVLKKADIRGLTAVRNQENPALWLEKELQAGFILGTDILYISLSEENPEEVATIVNAVKDVFVDQFDKRFKKDQADHYENITKALSDADVKTHAMRDDLKRLAKLHKTGDTQALTLRQKLAIEEYGSIKRELSSIEAEMRQMEALLAVLDAELKNPDAAKVPPEMMDEYLERDARVQKEHFEIARIEVQIKETRKFLVVGSSPRLTQLETDLKAAQKQLLDVKDTIQPELKKKAQAFLLAQRKNNIAQSAGKLEVLARQKAVVKAQVDERETEANNIGIGSFSIESRRSEIEASEVVLKKLRDEKERLEIERSNNKERETIDWVQSAEIPTLNQASLLKTGSLFSVAGLLLGLLGVSYFEARLHRVHQPTQVSQELGIQTLGMLPLLADNAARTYGQPQSAGGSVPDIMFSDAVDSLCARLLCDDRLGRNSVVMVTSATEDEGKTMLATHVAAGLARSGRRTLLIDCDFRNPRCHEQFGLADGAGLSEVLGGKTELANVLHQVPGSEAQFLPAGQSNPDVIKALTNGNFAALLARLRPDFDFIIVDSAPTPVVSDGLLIGKMVDGVILVVRPKVSKAPAVLAAYEQLAVLKIRILGAVVNAHSTRTSGYYK